MHGGGSHVRMVWYLAGITVLIFILSCAAPERASREEPVSRVTTPVREKTAILTLHSLRTEPTVVAAGKSFDLVVEYSVGDPAAGKAAITTRVRYCIYKGAVRIYTSKPVTVQGRRATVIRKRVRLDAPADPGAYMAKAFVYYGIMRISETVAFEVENGQ